MATHKPFRELVKPGSNFEFIGRTRLWATVSFLLIAGSIAMLFVNKSVRGDYLNWTIDFKGGTELIFEFCEPESGTHVNTVGAGDVRQALKASGFGGFEVSNFSWQGSEKCGQDDVAAQGDLGATQTVSGLLVRTPDFGALTEEQKDELSALLREKLTAACVAKGGTAETCTVENITWSGDRVSIRSSFPLDEEMVRGLFAERDLVVKAGERGFTVAQEEGIEEFNTDVTIFGLDRQFAAAIDKGLGEGVKTHVVQVYGVGAKAGAQLRNDGIKSLFYALLLIVLYLVFRFDIRYAPGAVVALIHDAILVIGVFAVTWTDVSLTSVAALLTVIGYSVNDSVIIFDRIRENLERLKDKSLERVVNISLNETLGRTLLTSSTLFAVTLMMNIFGTGLVRNFAFAMNVGVLVGTYSSIFVASPVMLWIDRTFYPAKAPGKSGRPPKKGAGSSARKQAAADDAAADAAVDDAAGDEQP